MDAILGVIKRGRVEVDTPPEWPEGALVRVELAPQAIASRVQPGTPLFTASVSLTHSNVRYRSSTTTGRRSYELFRPKTLYTLVTLLMRPCASRAW